MECFNKKLHSDLLAAYKSAYPKKTHAACDSDVSEIWRSLKAQQAFPSNVRTAVSELKEKSRNLKSNLHSFWSSLPKKNPVTRGVPAEGNRPSSTTGAGETRNRDTIDAMRNKGQPTPLILANSIPTPKQDEIKKQITQLSIEVSYLLARKNQNLTTPDEDRSLKNLQVQLQEQNKQLKKLEDGQKRSQRKRDSDKALYKELENNDPELAAKMRKRESRGRPRLEETQTGLMEAIVEIATYGTASMANDRRRFDELRTIKTLDELTEALKLRGYSISKSATYRRLLPKRADTSEGKQHVVTVPVKLAKATNDLRKEHSDTLFCRTAINYLEELASILGPTQVTFISQDDKARVPIGIVAANKQGPLLMHMEYRVRLPDHDFVVAERHKLIPSVYALIDVKPNKIGQLSAVGYTGPTYVAIRSGKHSSSNAFSHGQDLDTLFRNPEFTEYYAMGDGSIKPVLILTVDGGPDENPRYEKVQKVAITHFKRYNLDAIFIATNAPGRSAYNRVERRMAPLSKELSGLILEHDHFGSHLNESRKTIDPGLEKRNFGHAGKVLAEIWGSVVLDNNPVHAEYIDPERSEVFDIIEVTPEWRKIHVREGHYFFQVIKCGNPECCHQLRSSINKILKGFIPSPMGVIQAPSLVLSGNLSDDSVAANLLMRLQLDDKEFRVKETSDVPFDICCPSLEDILPRRCCGLCGVYHATQKSLIIHRKVCKIAESAPTIEPPSGLRLELQGRPVRIAATRQREKMILWTSRLNDNHADCVDDEDIVGLNINELNLASDFAEDIPEVSIDNHMSSPWEN